METTIIKKMWSLLLLLQLTRFKKKKSFCRNILRFAKPKSLNIQLERFRNPLVVLMFIKIFLLKAFKFSLTFLEMHV